MKHTRESMDKAAAEIRELIDSIIPKGMDYVFVLGAANFDKDEADVVMKSGGNLDLQDSLSMLKLYVSAYPAGNQPKGTLQ